MYAMDELQTMQEKLIDEDCNARKLRIAIHFRQKDLKKLRKLGSRLRGERQGKLLPSVGVKITDSLAAKDIREAMRRLRGEIFDMQHAAKVLRVTIQDLKTEVGLLKYVSKHSVEKLMDGL